MDKNKVKVVAPATSANVGSGYDACAFALALYNTLTFERTGSGLEITGCPEEHCNEGNMAYKTYKAVFGRAGKDVGGVKIDIETNVPICRGLGSSATLLIAGAVGANELLGRPFEKEDLLDICLEFEPHPDNVCACLWGGFTTAVKTDDSTEVFLSSVSPDLRFFAIIPDYPVSTEEARAIMPKEVALTDAVFDLSRAALLPRVFEAGDRSMVKTVTDDRLHQPYRSRLIKRYDDLREMSYRNGAYAFFISGSGSTCMAMSDGDDFIGKMKKDLESFDFTVEIKELTVDGEGARVV